jgi:hypothetical protein
MKFDFDIWKVTKSVVLVIAVIFVIFQFNNILDRVGSKPQKPEVVTIQDNAMLIRLQASEKKIKELEEELKKKDSVILKYAKDNKERLDEIGVIKAKLEQTRKLHQASDHVYLKGKVTDHHFIKIYKKASDGTEFPVAWAMFYPNQPDPNKLWKTGTYPLEFDLNIIETENKDGIYNRYAELNVENNQMKETKGNKYPVKITRLDWAKNDIKEKSFSFNPRLGLAMEITNDIAAPALDFSFASYGKTKVDMDWRILELSAGGTSDKFIFGFTPFSWNFGTALPVIKNAFIGPSVVWSTDGDVSYGVKFSVPF